MYAGHLGLEPTMKVPLTSVQYHQYRSKHDLVFDGFYCFCYDLLRPYEDHGCHMCEADFEKFSFGCPFNSVASSSFSCLHVLPLMTFLLPFAWLSNYLILKKLCASLCIVLVRQLPPYVGGCLYRSLAPQNLSPGCCKLSGNLFSHRLFFPGFFT